MRLSSRISDKERVGPGDCDHVNENEVSESVRRATLTRIRGATGPSTRGGSSRRSDLEGGLRGEEGLIHGGVRPLLGRGGRRTSWVGIGGTVTFCK